MERWFLGVPPRSPLPGSPTAAVLAADRWLPRSAVARRTVSVQPPCRAGSSEGAAVPWRAASPAATRKSSSPRPCCRHVAATVSNRSANRLPASLSDPKLPLRQSTAGESAHSNSVADSQRAMTSGKVSRAAMSSPAIIVHAPCRRRPASAPARPQGHRALAREVAFQYKTVGK